MSIDLVKILAGVLHRASEDLAEKLREACGSPESSAKTEAVAEKPLTSLAAAKAATAPKSAKKEKPAEKAASGSTSTEAATEKVTAHVCGPHAMHLDPAKYKAMIVAPAECYYCKQAAAQTIPSLTLKDVTEKAKELVAKCGKPKLAEVLKELGVAAVTPGPGKVSLPESEYSNFFKMCVAIMNAAATPPAIEEEEPL